MAKGKGNVISQGTVDTKRIYAAHTQIKSIVESYRTVNAEVFKITQAVKSNWVGKGCNEFESQYNLLIKKIDDFGDTLLDIYEGLVQAEADYEAADDSLRQQFVMAMEE